VVCLSSLSQYLLMVTGVNRQRLRQIGRTCNTHKEGKSTYRILARNSQLKEISK
jgi:hypothetical protein